MKAPGCLVRPGALNIIEDYTVLAHSVTSIPGTIQIS